MNNDAPIFILGGAQRCGQHCINNYIQAAYTKGAFKNDAPAHAPLTNKGAYRFVRFVKGYPLAKWWYSRLPLGASTKLFKKYDCLSVGIENHLMDPQWAERIINHCAEFSVSPQNTYIVQVVRSPLNNIASILKMWGAAGSGSFPSDSGGMAELVIKITERYLAAAKDTPCNGIESQEGIPHISYVVYDRFITDHEYRAKFYHSLPRTTEPFDSCEHILKNKVQLSSFRLDGDFDFLNRYRSMQNDPLVESVVTPELINLNEEFLQRAFYNQ